MREYHKIQSLYKRNERGSLIIGEYSLPEFAYLKDNEWIFTEKVDGANIRVMWDGTSLTFGGKTDNASIPATLVNALQTLFFHQRGIFAEQFPDGVCLYGEGYGAKIQKGGGNYRSDQSFVLFDVKIGEWWLQRQDIEEIANRLGIGIVPIIGRGTLYDLEYLVRKGFISRWGGFLAEGIVSKPAVELHTRRGDRIVVKLKYRDFIKI